MKSEIIDGSMGIVNFNNVGFEENHLHKLKYNNQKIKMGIAHLNVTCLYGYSKYRNEFFSDYLHRNPTMYYLDKELELSDLKNLDFTHGDFDSLLNGDVVTVRDMYVHLVDFGEEVFDATNVINLINPEDNKKISGKIYRKIDDCPYKSIKLDNNKTLIVIGKTGRGNTKIILK